MPQMVGGGTVHWQGWLPRFTPEDFRLRSIAGEVPGATLVDWPISYDDLEPYYDEGGVGVRCLRPGRGERVRGPAEQGLPVPADAAVPLRREVPRGLRAIWAGTPSRPRRPRCPGPSTAARPPWSAPSPSSTAIPTGTRSSALNVFIPDALATGRYDLRPDSYVRELVLDAAGPGHGPRSTSDADGNIVEQEADVFILAGGASSRPGCCSCRSPAASPTASPTAATWSAATSPSTSIQRRGRDVRGPDLRLGRRRLRQCELVPVLQPRRVAGLRQRRPHRGGRRRHPVADQLAPAWPSDLGS